MAHLSYAVTDIGTPIPANGKLEAVGAPYDECAECVRVLAREVLKYDVEDVLNHVMVTDESDGSLKVQLNHLDSDTADDLGALLIRHSHGGARIDSNDMVSVRFTRLDGVTPLENLINTIKDYGEAYGLRFKISEAVRDVQREREAQRRELAGRTH